MNRCAFGNVCFVCQNITVVKRIDRQSFSYQCNEIIFCKIPYQLLIPIVALKSWKSQIQVSVCCIWLKWLVVSGGQVWLVAGAHTPHCVPCPRSQPHTATHPLRSPQRRRRPPSGWRNPSPLLTCPTGMPGGGYRTGGPKINVNAPSPLSVLNID